MLLPREFPLHSESAPGYRTLLCEQRRTYPADHLYQILKYLQDIGVKPRSVKLISVVSALKGALRVVRAFDNVELYTLWMDPVLNSKAYILPGMGDAGDRINGAEQGEYRRNVIQLIADYGRNIAELYRHQIHEIEQSVLRCREDY